MAHELQQLKRSALLDVAALTEPDDRRCYAPWRDDPRPVSGLLQGAYAFLGVSSFRRTRRRTWPVGGWPTGRFRLDLPRRGQIGGGSKSKSSRPPAAATCASG